MDELTEAEVVDGYWYLIDGRRYKCAMALARSYPQYRDCRDMLIIACIDSKMIEMVKWHLDGGALPDHVGTAYRYSALFGAIYDDNAPAVDLILGRNVDVNIPDNADVTPINVARNLQHQTIITMLINAGAVEN